MEYYVSQFLARFQSESKALAFDIPELLNWARSLNHSSRGGLLGTLNGYLHRGLCNKTCGYTKGRELSDTSTLIILNQGRYVLDI